MRLSDKILALYLKPYWYFWCVGVFVQDKVFGTSFRNEGVRARAPLGVGLLALVAMVPTTLYAFVIPVWLIFQLSAQYQIWLIFLYAILFIGLMLYTMSRRKVLERAFTKPNFLKF